MTHERPGFFAQAISVLARSIRKVSLLALCLAAITAWPQAKDSTVAPQTSKTPAKDTEQTRPTSDSDIPKTFSAPLNGYDYVKREVMIPMRDGVKLYTVLIIPKGAKNAPILLTRTPYNAAKRVARNDSPFMLAALSQGDAVFTADGYIRVFQDVRGKYGSEGDYVMTRPVKGALNHSCHRSCHRRLRHYRLACEKYSRVEWPSRHDWFVL